MQAAGRSRSLIVLTTNLPNQAGEVGVGGWDRGARWLAWLMVALGIAGAVAAPVAAATKHPRHQPAPVAAAAPTLAAKPQTDPAPQLQSDLAELKAAVAAVQEELRGAAQAEAQATELQGRIAA